MSLLSSFVRFLQPAEVEQLNKIRLAGKEKMLLDFVVHPPVFEDPSKEHLQKLLNVSSAHYDKICTIVLKKVYKHLAGEEDVEQLNYLSKKQLFNHLFHEINLQAKRVRRDSKMAPAEKEKLFFVYYNLVLNVPAFFFNEKLVNGFAKEYLSYITKDLASKELEVHAKLLFARCNVQLHSPPNPRAIESFGKQLQSLERKYMKRAQPAAKVVFLRVMVMYYAYLEQNNAKRTECIQRIEHVVSSKSFEPNMVLFHRYLNYCHRAEMLFESGEYSAAFTLYHSTFAEQGFLLRNQFTHYARLVELSIILGKFGYASQILKKVFEVYVKNNHPSNGTLGSILYATFYLVQEDYDPVFDYIDKGMSLNSLQVYYLYKIKLRILENLYFALTGDLHFAARLSSKNIRYIQMQNLSLKTYRYAHLFIAMKNLQEIGKKGRAFHKVTKLVKEFEVGPDRIYGILLQRLLDKYAAVETHQAV